MLTHTYPHNLPGWFKWPYDHITRLTCQFMCGRMSYLLICKFRKSMVIHDTECTYWDQVSSHNTNPTQTPWRHSILALLTAIAILFQNIYLQCWLPFRTSFSTLLPTTGNSTAGEMTGATGLLYDPSLQVKVRDLSTLELLTFDFDPQCNIYITPDLWTRNSSPGSIRDFGNVIQKSPNSLVTRP